MTADTVAILVFTLFRPSSVEVRAISSPLTIRCTDGVAEVRILPPHAGQLHHGCTVDEPAGRFRLAIPGRIERDFEAVSLAFTAQGIELRLDLETAVAQVVASELPANAPAAAMEAQAIAARSYYAAGNAPPRHPNGRFCDTTHCQHIRGSLPASHPARQAAVRTRGLVLQYEGRTFAAMYSASCSGVREAGNGGGAGRTYPYFATTCEFCRRRPSSSSRRGLHEKGLCQAGAIDMARKGKGAEEILRHYYPGARVAATSAPQR